MTSEVSAAEDDRHHVVGSTSHATEGTRVLKHGETFAVLNKSGDMHQVGLGEVGLYYRGTRHASRLRLRLNKHRPLLLSSSVLENNLLLAVDLTNPDIFGSEQHVLIPYGIIHIARSTFLCDGVYQERLTLSNYGGRSVAFSLRLEFAADFADIFEVRGTQRPQRGNMLPARFKPGGVALSYRGLDEVQRSTDFEFSPPPDELTEEQASYQVALEPGARRRLTLRIICEQSGVAARPVVAYDAALASALSGVERYESLHCHIYSSNEQLNDWLNRSRSDLRMLTTNTAYGPYPYAGVPWFSTTFGRDGVWTALETLWFEPEIARGVLSFLSAHQATEMDPTADAEPGKIVHEMREGEMAALREIPFGRYYGSIDATPLYVMLAARYYERTGDKALVESIWPNLLKACNWMEEFGDMDGDGFIEYGRRSLDGLVQQGWKDSHDSVFHADGTAAVGPIALCEVQAYAYAAWIGMAKLARLMGHEERARTLETRAGDLRERFDKAFWCEDLKSYALALDGAKKPCKVKTSNVGHCLYCGIALPERVGPVAQQLMSDAMFSGWGVRTLAADERRYNPMSYHNGSIWPHDTAIVAEGLARTGHRPAAVRLFNALFDAALFIDLHRLPELFCGFERHQGQPPTRYPVACLPQAWASAAVFLLLKAVLGLYIEAVEKRVTFVRPLLPGFVQELQIRRLRVGTASVDLRLIRHPEDVGVTVFGATGDVEVVVIK